MTQFQVRPTVSVIIAIYNHFEWLRLILDALRMQTVGGFEVVLADDGSNKATIGLIDEYTILHPEMSIVHVWQPDEGWRKNKALNNAVRASSGEYLIFIDGDCIPHPEFIADHLRLAKKNCVIGGRRLDMSERISKTVEGWDSLPPGYFNIVRRLIIQNFLTSSPGETIKQLSRATRLPFIGQKPLFSKRDGFIGCNFSLFRSDLESVNGFDERYVKPAVGEDADLDVRLTNAGIVHLKYSHYALMLHRNHPRLEFGMEENMPLYREAVEKKKTFVEKGLFQKTE